MLQGFFFPKLETFFTLLVLVVDEGSFSEYKIGTE